MARVQWGQGTAPLARFRGKQNAPRLAVGGRLGKQTLDFIQRQAAVNEFDGCGFRYGIEASRLVSKDRKRLEVARLASILQPQPADLALLQPFMLAAGGAAPKHHRLPF